MIASILIVIYNQSINILIQEIKFVDKLLKIKYMYMFKAKYMYSYESYETFFEYVKAMKLTVTL